MATPTLICVDKQPIGSFDKWLSRGINCFIGAEPNDKPAQTAAWEDELERRGVWYMSYPSDDPARFAIQCTQKYRLAWMQNDEPDINRFSANGSNYPLPGWGWTDPNVLAMRYARCKAASPLPVFTNFAGPSVASTGDDWKYPPYVKQSDWLGHDFYVRNRAQSSITATIGKCMANLSRWSKLVDNTDRPQFVYIECSDQMLGIPGGRSPTPDEMAEEVRFAIDGKAKGIIYFPQCVKPSLFNYDATTPEMQARMKAINAAINPPVIPPPTYPTDPAVLKRIEALEKKMLGISQASA